ncbi:hypothetical protein COEREDRAFT_12766 [Coemansia reversa NRRL 1564]|uniref:Uncharacterized protein n=1 Tax=Coemansia reversa (strain ATCC 12441 / NRRL 1564) TaxID=763665 RepID=A0A2G5B0D5_COERN|nr:hypothetical protein COEREDRAFT_12766 [Coemansia reversa NRRL 1564]|eukprot:PIA12479.1 hypothetical protein COEREDRAFT_12766 [Coemansia reversa NRRL 1564]
MSPGGSGVRAVQLIKLMIHEIRTTEEKVLRETDVLRESGHEKINAGNTALLCIHSSEISYITPG